MKTAKRTIPLNLPSAWLGELDSLAVDAGMSRNAAICLAIRVGAPMLRANHTCLRVLVRELTAAHQTSRLHA